MYCSFRPLSGNYISQWFGRLTVLCEDGRFPSPVGELHFSIGCAGVYSDKKRVSVPCRGTTFLNRFPKILLILTCCFRPLSGNYISQCSPPKLSKADFRFRPLSGNYISQYHPYNPATSLGSWSGLRGKNIFGKINKIHSLKSAAKSVFKPCAAKSKQIFSFIKKYQFHIVPSYILFPDSGYISKYVVKPSFLYLYNVYDLVAHLFCQRYLLLFQYLLFHQT